MDIIRPYISLPPSELIQCLGNLLEESDPPLEGIESQRDPQLDFSQLHPIFSSYQQQFQRKTEAPLEYIAAAFLTSLGAAIGNRMVLKRGKGVMPNIYIMIVGASTFMRKSTAINLGLKPLKIINKEIHKEVIKKKQIYKIMVNDWIDSPKNERLDLPPPPKDLSIFFPDQVTPAQFLIKLEERPDKLLYFDEIGRFLAMIKGKSNLGFKEMLTELFDKEYGDTYTRETKTSGSVYIESPCISFIGASTFEWLQTHLKDSDLRSGFLARFCYVIKKEYPKESIANPDFIEIDKCYLELFRYLNSLETTYLEQSSEAKEFYKSWYENNKPKVLEEDMFIHSVMGRIFEVFHKIAIINHAIDLYEETVLSPYVVEKRSYEQALPWVNFFIANVKNHYQELTQKTNLQERKVIEIIKKRGKFYGDKKRLPRSELFKYANLKKSEGEQIINTLVVKQLLSVVERGNRTYYEVLHK